jgi:hypothetical protein
MILKGKDLGQWCSDCGTHLDWKGMCPECDAPDSYDDDGQPDEQQEWTDFDPDC